MANIKGRRRDRRAPRPAFTGNVFQSLGMTADEAEAAACERIVHRQRSADSA